MASASKKSKKSKKSKISKKSQRERMAEDRFAFPAERKEPLTDASHVRNAVARFNQVKDVTDAERDRAWKRIRSAAKRHKVKLSAKNWRSLGGKPAEKSGKRRGGS
jgi:hypothetical protein